MLRMAKVHYQNTRPKDSLVTVGLRIAMCETPFVAVDQLQKRNWNHYKGWVRLVREQL